MMQNICLRMDEEELLVKDEGNISYKKVLFNVDLLRSSYT
jgi:hypothetical protein